MTWFGWLLLVDLAFSSAFFTAKNDDRKPLTRRELATKVLTHIAYIVAILAVGTGSL